MVTCRLACSFLLAAFLVLGLNAAPSPQSKARPRALKRSDAKRWQRLKDGAKAEIKVATQKFLQEREQRLTLPLEVDVMLIGLEGDGAYHYRLDASELDELLSAQYVGRDLCPTIWESGQQSAVCASVSTVDLPVHDQNQALDSVELVLRNNMKLIGQQPPYPGAPAESGVPLYEIDAVHVEGEIHNLVAQAYNAEGFGAQTNEDGTHKNPLEHRLAVVVINPSKHRMNPNVTLAQGMSDWHDMDLLQEWKEGRINSSRVRASDGGYAYRYSYNGKGAAEAFVSSYNFVLLDLSAGPAHFGPLTSLGGLTAPSGLPRLEPMMEALAMEVEDAHQFTLHESLVHDAIDAHHRILLGQLASSIASAIDHLMAPDIARKRLEVATTLLVSLVVLQDHDDFNLLDHQNTQILGVEQEIDTTAIQEAMEQLMPKETQCVMMPSEARLHHMPEVLMALSRARMSWSDAVMLDSPYAGLHRSQHTKIDSRMLMQELKQFVPTFTSNPWVEDSMAKRPNASLASSVYHSGMRHLPVIVLSLKTAPPGMMFENGELVAADHEMVVVLQLLQANTGKDREAKAASVKLLPKPAYITAEQEEASQRLRLYSGHQQDGRPLEMDGARDLTAHIVGGLAMSLGGLVAPWERADSERPGRTQQDWRWAVGCVPWGPYANCTRISGLIQAAARRNQVMSHIETALVMVQGRLDDIDRLVGEVYEGPWPELIGQMVPHSLNETRQESQRHRHWLDVLHSRSKGHKGPISPALILNLENELAGVEMYIASLAWVLWSQTWEMAREQVTGLLNAADEFVAHADSDLNLCRQVAACCSVHHGRPILLDTFLIVTFLFFLIVFAMIAFIAMASQKIYKPSKRPSSSSGGMFPSSTYGGQSQGYGAGPWSGGGSGGFAPPYGSGGGSGGYAPPYAAGGMGGSGSFQAPWSGGGSSGSMPRAGVSVPGSRSGSLIPQWGGSGNQGGNTLLPR